MILIVPSSILSSYIGIEIVYNDAAITDYYIQIIAYVIVFPIIIYTPLIFYAILINDEDMEYNSLVTSLKSIL